MSSTWIGGGNIQISSNGIQNIKSDGYVTKKHVGYGCIDKNTLFNFGVVQGPLPNVGDKVNYEAHRTTAAQCWNATKVKVMQFAQNFKKQEQPAQQYPMYTAPFQQTSPATKTQTPRFNMYPQQQSKQITPYNPQIRNVSQFADSVQSGNFNKVVMSQILSQQSTSTFTTSGAKRHRFDAGPATVPLSIDLKQPRVIPIYQPDRIDRKRRSRSPPTHRKRSYSRSRSPRRSDSPRRSPRRSRSPRRKRSPRPRYSVRFAKFNLLRPSLDVLFMQQHYPSLYIPSDVSSVFRHAVYHNGDTIPFSNIIRYHVINSSQALTVASGSKAYRSKVLLLKSVSKTKLYHTVLNDKKENFLKLLSFWCNCSDKEITAFGGTWNSELDGSNPENPQTLINTAIRNVKAQLGIDLSYCKAWYKVCEVHYHRVNDKRNTEEHVERTFIYLPSIWDCQPCQEDWDILKHPVYKPPAEKEGEGEGDIDVVVHEFEFEAEEDDVVVEPSEAPATTASSTDPGGEVVVKHLKVTELRNELDRRGLSTKGLKIQLIARLQKAIKDQLEPVGHSGSVPEQAANTDTATATQHWKLQPEIQKKMNILINRFGICEKDIPDLPDLASIVLHPAKGVEVQDYSLSALLDYNKSDKKERVFEVSLFAEVIFEMFQRHFALLILKALIEADGESEECEEGKGKRTRCDSGSPEGGRKESESDKTHENSPGPESSSTRTEKYVHRPDLLLSFLFFDKNRSGYLAEDDILSIIHSIGLNISRSQIKVILDKVLMGKSKLNYRSLCERLSTGGTNIIQQETAKLKEIEEVLLLGTTATTGVVKVEVSNPPKTEREPSVEPTLPQKPVNDVVVVGGSYVVRSELPDLLSKAMKKVSGLEGKIRDLERQNEKLEKRIEESKNVKHSYVDLEQEVKKRKNELDILSEEKTRSELAARNYRSLLESTKTTLNTVISQISGSLEEGDKIKADDKSKCG